MFLSFSHNQMPIFYKFTPISDVYSEIPCTDFMSAIELKVRIIKKTNMSLLPDFDLVFCDMSNQDTYMIPNNREVVVRKVSAATTESSLVAKLCNLGYINSYYTFNF